MEIQIRNLVAGYKRGIPVISVPSWGLNYYDKIVVVQGQNGSGKTSFLKVIFGGIPIHSGQIFLGNEELKVKTKSTWLKKIGICLHKGLSYDHLSVKENVRLFGYIFPKAPEEYLNSLYHSLDLYQIDHVKAANLSTGQRKRLDFYLSLQHLPQMVILDEPTANLDPANSELILSIIRDYSIKRNIQFIIASNNESEVSLLNARVVQIVHGEVLLDKM